MAALGDYVIYLLMICAILGAFAAIKDSNNGLGKEFMQGFYVIGQVFIPTAGVMASIPIISYAIEHLAGPLFGLIGADPAIAATFIFPADMGAYQLSDVLAHSREAWIITLAVGLMAGPTIAFAIPVGLTLLDKKDHKYLALGVMAGLLGIPIGVLIYSVLINITSPMIRELATTQGESTYQLALDYGTMFINLIPLIIFVGLIAFGLRFYPDFMIRGFMIFGRTLDAFLKIVLVFSIVEYFTGFFSSVFEGWVFDPIIADDEDNFRALEVAGFIGIMLAGAFPFIYLLKKYLGKPLSYLGGKIGLKEEGSAGILAASANILAMFYLIRTMAAKDKVINIAFAVCAGFLVGDHLSFTANFQPNLIVYILIAKIMGAIAAILFAYWLSVPKALELEKKENKEKEVA